MHADIGAGGVARQFELVGLQAPDLVADARGPSNSRLAATSRMRFSSSAMWLPTSTDGPAVWRPLVENFLWPLH
jgi:hypothetical protein